jgi:hypothetical protein
MYPSRKKDFIDALLYDRPYWIHINELEEMYELREKVLIYKSMMGHEMNRIFDDIMVVNGNGGFNDFYKLVIEELDESYYEFMFLLYNRLSIEEELNYYIVKNLDKIIEG